MGATVDERIVAAKFDASDFEKGVDKTLKKLDELKKSLDLKEATKGVKELAEKTEVSTNSLSNSLEKLTDRFTTFTGMIKQKILSGLADEVANVFLRMEQGVKSFIKSISSDQVSAGMSKYEQMLTSVRIMMSAGETEGSAYEAIGQLRDYSDQTSYSLSQMTDALSKLRAAGVDLKTATKSVEGIANACANAGINATDAQRAFFNLSQAYSSGVLKYTDYRSLELLNMTTDDFKQKILDAAVEAKTLKKVSEGVYQTISTGNKKVTSGKKVTKKNLQDMLRYNFVTSDVMNELFGGKFFFDEKAYKEYKSKYNNLDEAIAAAKKDYGETAVNAYLAAREARSFTDVMNTLKDVVSTGWSTTFEHLFGRLEQAKKFFTELAEGGIAEVVYSIGEYRNAVLGFWDDSTDGVASGGGEVLRQSILNINEAIGTLLKTLLDIVPAFNELNNEEDEGTPGLQHIGDKLFMLTMRFRDMTERIKTAAEEFRSFMNSPIFEKGPTRIEMIRRVIHNLFSAFSIVAKTSSLVVLAFNKVYQTLYPVFDGILNFIEKITHPLRNLQYSNVFDDVENSIQNIFTILDPIAKVLEKIIGFLGDVGAFFVQMAIDTATSNISLFADVLGLFMELFTGKSSQMEKGEGILARINKDFEGIKTACTDGLIALNAFFGALIDDIKKLLGLTDGESDQNGGIFDGVINFFKTNKFVQDVKAWFNQAIIDIGDFVKSIPSRIKKLGANIYDAIRKLLFTTEQKEGSSETKEILTPLGEWLNQVIIDIKAFIIDIPNKILRGIGRVFNWIDTIFDIVFFGKSNKTSEKGNDKTKEAENTLIAQFDEFIAGIKDFVSDWFDDLPNKISKAFASTGSFLKRVISAIDEFMFGKKQAVTIIEKNKSNQVKEITKRIKSGFSLWLDGFIKDIKKFIKNIPEYIKKGIKGAGDIVSSIVRGIFGKNDGGTVTSEDIQNAIKKPFEGISLTSILNTIKDIGKTLINQIARIFTGTEDIDTNKQWLADRINDAINWIVEKIPKFISSAWSYIKNFGINVWNGLKHVFNDEEVSNDDPIITQAIVNIGRKIKYWLTNDKTGLPKYFNDAWNWLKESGYSIWAGLKGAFIDGGIDGYESELAQKVYDIGTNIKMWLTDDETGLPSYINAAWEWLKQTGHNIWVGLKSIFSSEGMPSDNHSVVAEFINTVGTKIREWFTNDQDGFPYYFDLAWTAVKEFGHNIWTGFKSIFSEDGLPEENQSTVASFISNLGMRIKEWFTDDQNGFPAVFRTAWKAVSDFKSGVFEGIAAVFSGDIPQSEVGKAIADVGNKLKTFITVDLKDSLTVKIPEFLRSIWAGITSLAGDLWEGLSGIFSGNIPESEIGLAVYEIGNKIKTFILVDVKDYLVKNIPDFIHSAWDALVSLGTDIFAGFASIFTGATPENETQKAIHDFGEMVKNFIVTDLPKMIIEAFEEISKVFNNAESSTINDDIQKANDVVFGEVVDETLKAQKKADKELNGETKKSGFWTFIENLKNGFLEVLSSIGPSILNGIASALDWIGQIATFISDAIEGNTSISNEIDKAYGQEKPELVAALNRIGESIKNFFLDTLPKFIGSAIGALAKEAPKWFGKLFGAMGEAAADAADSTSDNSGIPTPEDAAESIGGVLGIVKTMIESVASFVNENDAVITVIGLTVALGLLFKELKELFSIADDAENVGYAVKWTAIFVAILALSRIVSSITDLVNSGDPTKIENFKTIMDSLGDVLGKIAWIVGLFAAIKVADVVGDFSSGGLTDVIPGLGALLGSIGIAVGANITAAGVDSSLNILGDALVDFSSTLDDIMNIFNPFLDKLNGAAEKIKNATDVVDLISELVTKFYKAFGTIYQKSIGIEVDEDPYNLLSAGDASSNLESFVEGLSLRVKTYLDAVSVFNQLIDALQKMGDIDTVKDQLENFRTLLGVDENGHGAFADLLTDLFKVLDASFTNSEIYSYQYNEFSRGGIYDGIAAAMSILSDSISVLGEALSDVDKADIETFKEFLKFFEDLGKVVNDEKISQSIFSKIVQGDQTLSAIGREIRSFAMYIKGFYANIYDIKGFEDTEVAKTKAKIESVVAVAQGFIEASNMLSSNLGRENLETFSAELPAMGKAFAEFAKNMHDNLGELTAEDLKTVSDAANSISNISNMFALLVWNNTDELINKIHNAFTTTENVTKLTDAMSGLVVIMANALSNDEYMQSYIDSGKVIASYITAGIEQAFIEDPTLQPEITPVLNMETAKQQLRDFFGVGDMHNVDLSAMVKSAAGANAQTDEDRVYASVLYEKIGEVTAAVDLLKTSQVTVRDVANAFGGMRIVTDTGALVGALTDDIDAAIGRKIWMIERFVTPTGASFIP